MNKCFFWLFVYLFIGLNIDPSLAQDFIVDGSKVSVTSNTFLIGARDLSLTNTSELVNHLGTITVSRHITNMGTITSTGVEILNGTADQIVSGVNGASFLGDVYRVQPSGVNIIAGSDWTMQSFDFGNTNGMIQANDPSGRTVRILNSTDTAIKKYNNNRYIDLGDNYGTLERAVATLDTLAFPVGNPTAGYRLMDYHPMNIQAGFTRLKVINGTPSALPNPASYIRVFPTGFENSLSGTGCTPGGFIGHVMFECLTDHYWHIATPSPSAEYFVEIFNDACYDVIGPDGAGPRRVLRVPGSSPTNAWFTPSYVEDVQDVPLSDNYCLYSDWTRTRDTIPGGIYADGGLLAIATGSFYPLPVEFVSITAQADEARNNILVRWVTASELNADRYEILRSENGIDFVQIGSIGAAGTTSTSRSYQWVDEQVQRGIVYYYRLRQVDYDDKSTLSNIVSAQLVPKETVSELVIYPNPTSHLVHVSQAFDAAELLNITGQQMPIIKDKQSIDLQYLPSGMYLLKIKIGDHTKNFKVEKL